MEVEKLVFYFGLSQKKQKQGQAEESGYQLLVNANCVLSLHCL